MARSVDVVYGRRTERKDDTRFKRWTAAVFYRFLDRFADISVPLDTGDFRLMDRRVVDAFLAMPERDRFVRGMVAWTGFRQEPVEHARASRAAGETKYPLRKMLRFAADGVLSFSSAPLRLTTWLGFLASGLALSGIVYVLVIRIFTDLSISGWASLLARISHGVWCIGLCDLIKSLLTNDLPDREQRTDADGVYQQAV